MLNRKTVIALLDDESDMLKALRRLLTGHGYCVEEYRCGKDFLATAGSRLPDCLLLDLHMPELNGFEVLEAMQSRHIALPVIVITAHHEPGTEQRVIALGAAGYLKKPVERESLLTAIERAIPGNACCSPTVT